MDKKGDPLKMVEPAEDSNDIEQQKANAKRRDQYFEQLLRIFYKNMIDRLGPTNKAAIERISKKSSAFCEQLNKI